MKDERDIRTLCNSCKAEYEEAGYQLIKVWVKNKEECDHCLVRMGWNYEIVDHFRSSVGKSGGCYRSLRREFKSHRK